MAADIEAWVTTGRPTPDLPYVDRADVRTVALARGAAPLVERFPAASCARAGNLNQAQRAAAPDPI